MLVFAARRFIQAIPILLGVSLVVFGLVHIVPRNPIDLLMPPEASPEIIEQMKKALGFDQPLYMQYLLWLTRAIQGDFGLSVFNATPVWGMLITALGNTFILAIMGAALGFSLGTVLGLTAAVFLGRWPVIRHVCKNAAPPVLALMGLQFGYLLGGSILVETVFNRPGSGDLLNLAIFLGLGVTPPQAEWGLMLNSLRQAIYVQPYVAALPGLMIFLTSMCFKPDERWVQVSDGREAEQVRSIHHKDTKTRSSDLLSVAQTAVPCALVPACLCGEA